MALINKNQQSNKRVSSMMMGVSKAAPLLLKKWCSNHCLQFQFSNNYKYLDLFLSSHDIKKRIQWLELPLQRLKRLRANWKWPQTSHLLLTSFSLQFICIAFLFLTLVGAIKHEPSSNLPLGIRDIGSHDSILSRMLSHTLSVTGFPVVTLSAKMLRL